MRTSDGTNTEPWPVTRRRLTFLLQQLHIFPPATPSDLGQLSFARSPRPTGASLRPSAALLRQPPIVTGIRARPIARCLREAIASELDHAQRLAIRIKQLHGSVPGADDFTARKLYLRPPAEPLDSVSVLTAMIEAETAAIDRDRAIAAAASDASDWITQDLAIQLIQEKQSHRRSLQSYVAELAKS